MWLFLGLSRSGTYPTEIWGPSYLELAEDAEDLGEGSRYREHPVVRVPWTRGSGEILEGLAIEHVELM